MWPATTDYYKYYQYTKSFIQSAEYNIDAIVWA